jgi:lipopolysaccharide transport system ATP-binding protein
MYVRLAFAVAAHLQSEILILDEVLAVGDLAFQRKCLDKVQALAHDEGRTVLLVSHNAEVIRHNATSAIRLDSGRLTVVGTVDEALDDSVAGALPWQADLSTVARVDPNWGRVVRMTSVVMADGGHVPFGGDLRYRVTFQATERLELGVGQAVTGLDEAPIATSFSPLETYEAGEHTVEITVPRIPVAPGSYALNIVIGHASFAVPDLHLDGVMRAVGFTVVDGSMTVDWHPEWWGSVAMAEPRVRRVDVGS